MKRFTLVGLLLLSFVLAACGKTPAPPAVDITSPEDGAVITAEMQTVTGTATGDIASLSYTFNGGAAQTITVTDKAFSFDVALVNGTNTIKITAQGEKDATATDTVSVVYAPVVNTETGTTYSGELTESDPTFVKPDIGFALTNAQRTVPYEVYAFSVPEQGYYEILSEQSYDGYLDFYVDGFDPANPSQNLFVYNDDFGGGYDPETDPAAQSRLVYELEPGKAYFVVTNACGGEGSSCGPDTGTYTNTISAGAEPPPPTYTLPTPDNAAYNITLRYGGDELSPERKAVFESAAARWSQIITSDLQNVQNFNLPPEFVFPGTGQVVGELDDVLIDVFFTNIDDPGGVLGAASSLLVRGGDSPNANLTTYGYMYFDTSEFGDGGFFDDPQQFQDTIAHEMGHVLGIGTLWDLTGNTEGVLDDPPTVPAGFPNLDYDPRFTGEAATAAYQALLAEAGRDSEDSVPIANTGGPGSYNGHWRERTFGDELMTPYTGGGDLLSKMTAASLGDLGYSVDANSQAVDAGYVLPPPPVPAVFKQTAPATVTYTEYEDFAAASASPKATVEAAVVNVDLNLNDLIASTSGCEATDFDAGTNGKIALVRRGGCDFNDKVLNAQDAGAMGVIIMNQGNAEDRKGLLDPALSDDVTVPVVFVTFDLGVSLANTSGLEVFIDTGSEPVEPLSLARGRDTDFVLGEVLIGPIGTVSADGRIDLQSGADPRTVFAKIQEAVQNQENFQIFDR